MVQTGCVLYILTSKRVSRHNGVHFLDISTSERGPRMCFVHVYFQMCFAPQQHALFQPCSDTDVLVTFWLPNLLHASDWKNMAFRDFSTFSFSSLIFFLLLGSSLTALTPVASSAHIVGSLTSKLPSMIETLQKRRDEARLRGV